jgi:putative membrane protein insertion efficiency factor
VIAKVSTLVRWLLTFLVLLPVRFYQLTIGPILSYIFPFFRCPFDPSCSVYFTEAVLKHGPIQGSLKGIWRICRCNPWSHGGFDPP